MLFGFVKNCQWIQTSRSFAYYAVWLREELPGRTKHLPAYDDVWLRGKLSPVLRVKNQASWYVLDVGACFFGVSDAIDGICWTKESWTLCVPWGGLTHLSAGFNPLAGYRGVVKLTEAEWEGLCSRKFSGSRPSNTLEVLVTMDGLESGRNCSHSLRWSAEE